MVEWKESAASEQATEEAAVALKAAVRLSDVQVQEARYVNHTMTFLIIFGRKKCMFASKSVFSIRRLRFQQSFQNFAKC